MKKLKTLSEQDQEENFILVNAIGDGRCAYNAFALALVDLIFANQEHFAILAQQGLFKTFLDNCQFNWDSFLQFLNENRANKNKIQHQLSVKFKILLKSLMRPPLLSALPQNCIIADGQIVDDPQIYLYNLNKYLDTINNPELMALLRDLEVCLSSQYLTFNRPEYDEVYVCAPSIREKFRELHQEVYENHCDLMITLAKLKLLQWYCYGGGFQSFRDYICDVNIHNAWGGQMELRLLANYWRVGLRYFRGVAPAVSLGSGITVPSEIINQLDESIRRLLLVDRNIIQYSPDDNCYEVLITDVQKIEMLCAPLPDEHFATVQILFNKGRDKFQESQESDKAGRSTLGDQNEIDKYNLPQPLIQKLLARGILQYHLGEYKFPMDDIDRVKRAYFGVPRSTLTILLPYFHPENHVNLVMHLRNNGGHWNYERNPALLQTWPELSQANCSSSSVTNVTDLIIKALSEVEECKKILSKSDRALYARGLELFLQSRLHNRKFLPDILNIILLDYFHNRSLPNCLSSLCAQEHVDMMNAGFLGLQNKVQLVVLGLTEFLKKYGNCLEKDYKNRLRMFLANINQQGMLSDDSPLIDIDQPLLYEDLQKLQDPIVHNQLNKNPKQLESIKSQLQAKLTTIFAPIDSIRDLVGRYNKIVSANLCQPMTSIPESLLNTLVTNLLWDDAYPAVFKGFN